MQRALVAPLILASASPRRTELLTLAGLGHEVLPASVDETRHDRENPIAYVRRLAQEKAQAVACLRPASWVLGADTVVVLDEEIMGKPEDEQGARRMLARLSGRTHQVVTGFCLVNQSQGPPLNDHTLSLVTFRPLDPAETAWYAGTSEPMGKAGAYAIQGLASAFVSRVEGSYTGVVGLPLAQVIEALKKLKIFQ